MPSQVNFGASNGSDPGQIPVDIGSVFGLDAGVINAPVRLSNGGGYTTWGHPRRPVIGTVLQAVASWHSLSSEARANYSSRLENAGYLESNVDSKGRVKKRNPKTVEAAWRAAVLDAARSDRTVDDVLDQTAAEQEPSLGDAALSQSRAATNPLDLQALARQEGTAGLGRGLTASEQAQVIAATQAAEAPYLDSAGASSPPGAAGMGLAAQQAVKKLDPIRYDARNVVKVASVLARMLGGQMPSESAHLPGDAA